MIGFPLLLIPLAIYNIIVLLMPGVSFADPLVRLTLVSGAEWPVTLSDVLLVLAILMLLLEVFKGARPGAKYLTDHLLSLILFGAAAAEFVLWPKFGTSTYFLLVLLALTDFLSGVGMRAGHRMPVARRAEVPRQRPPSETKAPAVEPQLDPVPVPAPPAASVPEAASVAEAVPLEHPEPNPEQPAIESGQPAIESGAASPEIPSPGLQPGSGSHTPPETPSH
jgi:hypothetical protein